jgi:hypothetical protein
MAVNDMEDRRTRASSLLKIHCRCEAVDGPSSKYTTQSTRLNLTPSEVAQAATMKQRRTHGTSYSHISHHAASPILEYACVRE